MNRKSTLPDVAQRLGAQLDFARPTSDQIVASLRSAILSMQLPPGQMISENEIGQMVGASRTPVREAFAQLREEGLIATWPSRGTFVTRLSENQIRGAQFLRESLEVSVAERLCAEGLPDASRAALTENLALQNQAVAAAEKDDFQRLDDRFHALLAEATGFDRIASVLIREKAALDRLRVLSLNDTAHMARLLSQHEAIFDAINTGDPNATRAHVRAHLRGVLDILADLIAANRDYFDLTDG